MLAITDGQHHRVHSEDSLLDGATDEADIAHAIVVTAWPVDMSYPLVPIQQLRVSGWFEAEIYRDYCLCYHHGIEYVYSVDSIR